MPLIVPVLRLAYVFLNVFDTFKTLRHPPPSARNNGQPSARAMSQRKRAMKGCMAVWIVWVCFVVYERTVDSMVRLFIPFYDEVKSLVILFFLFTRARGAEPIFLHVFRPLVKPYAATIDSTFEFVTTFGDFAFLLSTLPVHYALDYYRQWRFPSHDALSQEAETQKKPAEAEREHRAVRKTSGQSGGAMPAFEVESTRHSRLPGGSSKQTRAAASSKGQTAQSRPATGRVGSSGIPHPVRSTRSVSQQQNQTPDVAPPPYEIWYPSTTSHAPGSDPVSGLPTPPADNPPPFTSLAHESEATSMDEWRQYPAFPSAYPATPLPVPPRLPSVNMPTVPASTAGIRVDDIPEEPSDSALPPGLSHTSAKNPTLQQDFHESLPSPPESTDPDLDGASSDYADDMPGVQQEHDQAEAAVVEDDNMDDGDEDDDDDDDEEDDFDVTLRTPLRKMQVDKVTKEKASLTSSSTESLAEHSTGLSTTDHGSSLRTRTNSLVSTRSNSDASSMASKKRPLPPAEVNVARQANRIRAKPSTKTLSVRPTAVQLQSRMRAAARERAKADRLSSAGVTADDDTAETDSDASGAGSSDFKRRRVPGAPGERIPRPAATRGDSNRTIRAANRTTMLDAPAARRPSRRAPPKASLREHRDAPTVRARRQLSAAETGGMTRQ